jgi:glycosyltransferase involved in cell wall biosynthesis
VTITNEFFLPLVLRRHRAGKIYVQVGRYPKGQMFLYSRADRLQAVSQAVGDAIVRQTPWLASKVSVIGYALADDYFAADAVPLQREKTILYVGRIAREKGIELLIGAFLALSRDTAGPLGGWKLRIIGPSETMQGGDGGDYLRRLRALAEPLGERCEFAGPIFDQPTLIRAYRSSSVFVYPSLAEFGESFGMAPLEAMASGCAAIVSRLRCFDDFIEPGVTGLQFDHRGARPHENLAAELSRLTTQPELLGRIAIAGRETAALFRTGVIAGRMLADFRSLTGDV